MVKSSTVYTKEILDEFASYLVRKNKSLILIYVCAGIILACSIAMFILGEIVDGVLYVLLGAFFACYGLILKLIIKQGHKKIYGNYDEFEFDEDFMTIRTYTKTGEQLTAGTINYKNILKLEENKDKAYIFVSKYNAYIIEKSNFAVGEYEGIIEKIQSKIGSS